MKLSWRRRPPADPREAAEFVSMGDDGPPAANRRGSRERWDLAVPPDGPAGGQRGPSAHSARGTTGSGDVGSSPSGIEGPREVSDVGERGPADALVPPASRSRGGER
ncbi:hypothetical protein GCM10010106_12590 [Thermopolyspora flexuosa]|nr:hypothetical protein GCM10010106_12590 [Thermopolyspora flexuosa]